jgi:nifR3 family TIM-barrel protein
MAGVTNAPFRLLCRRYGSGLYVSEMVLAAALLHGNARTERMLSFAPSESPRSVQLYGTDPTVVGEAVRRLVGGCRVDHVDLNFGCPAAKVTRRGGGAAVPAKPRLLAAIVRAAVGAADRVPVTLKFRIGLWDGLDTFVAAGRAGEGEGAAAVALHARTAEQQYAGTADWPAIARLKEAISTIPVLGNGDIWEASDAIAMMASTGCDGVVVGRGCLGRPWLFRDLTDAFEGRPVEAPPPLGTVAAVLREHAQLLVELFEGERGIRELRKHTGWYLTGYPVGGEVRRRLASVASLAELDDLLGALDPTLGPLPGAARMTRGHTHGPRRVALPDGYLDRADDGRPFDPAADALVSGG